MRHARGPRQRIGDVVGRPRDADDRQRAARPTFSAIADAQAHSRATPCSTTTSPAAPHVPSLDDLVAAAPAEHQLEAPLARAAARGTTAARRRSRSGTSAPRGSAAPRTRSSSVARLRRAKRAITSGRSARSAARSKPVESAKPTATPRRRRATRRARPRPPAACPAPRAQPGERTHHGASSPSRRCSTRSARSVAARVVGDHQDGAALVGGRRAAAAGPRRPTRRRGCRSARRPARRPGR